MDSEEFGACQSIWLLALDWGDHQTVLQDIETTLNIITDKDQKLFCYRILAYYYYYFMKDEPKAFQAYESYLREEGNPLSPEVLGLTAHQKFEEGEYQDAYNMLTSITKEKLVGEAVLSQTSSLLSKVEVKIGELGDYLIHEEAKEKRKRQTKRKGAKSNRSESVLATDGKGSKEKLKANIDFQVEKKVSEVSEEELGKEKISEEESKTNFDNPVEEKVSEEELKPNFNIPVTLYHRESTLLYNGVLHMGSIKLPKFFILSPQFEADEIGELIQLSHQHMCFLTVEGYASYEGENMILTEPVCSVLDYFNEEYRKLCEGKVMEGDEDNRFRTWWSKIEENFRSIFRDIIQALVFLFENDDMCEDLRTHTYVTNDFKGRILPVPKSSMCSRDIVSSLVNLMRLVIEIPGGSLESAYDDIPLELRSFFKTVTKYISVVPELIPAYFIVDHPYFWVGKEKVEFILNFKRYLLFSLNRVVNLERSMKQLSMQNMWWGKLGDLFYDIWDYARQKNLSGYNARFGVFKFQSDVYTHSNDEKYTIYRVNGQCWTDEDLRHQLDSQFPTFYIDWFDAICYSVWRGDEWNLKEIRK